MAHNLNALKAGLKMVVDAGKDSLALIAAGSGVGSVFKAILAYQNLLADLMDLVPQIGEIPSEAAQLSAEDALELASYLVAECGLHEGHVKDAIESGLVLLNHVVHDVMPVVGKVLPAIEHLIDVLKGSAAK
jgi:hypothetical protein